jgi:hypothetical protein
MYRVVTDWDGVVQYEAETLPEAIALANDESSEGECTVLVFDIEGNIVFTAEPSSGDEYYSDEEPCAGYDDWRSEAEYDF